MVQGSAGKISDAVWCSTKRCYFYSRLPFVVSQKTSLRAFDFLFADDVHSLDRTPPFSKLMALTSLCFFTFESFTKLLTYLPNTNEIMIHAEHQLFFVVHGCRYQNSILWCFSLELDFSNFQQKRRSTM